MSDRLCLVGLRMQSFHIDAYNLKERISHDVQIIILILHLLQGLKLHHFSCTFWHKALKAVIWNMNSIKIFSLFLHTIQILVFFKNFCFQENQGILLKVIIFLMFLCKQCIGTPRLKIIFSHTSIILHRSFFFLVSSSGAPGMAYG